jgi:primosomal replication protein N
MDDNAVTLAGTLAHVEPLRHTPAGLPLLQFTLAHKSVQIEAGYKRQVECEVSCVAMGEAATELARSGTGVGISVTGFLNRKNRMSAQLVLHATKTDLVKE